MKVNEKQAVTVFIHSSRDSNCQEKKLLRFSPFRSPIVLSWTRATDRSFTIIAFWAKINVFFKNTAKIGKVAKVAIIVTKPLLLIYFVFMVVETGLLPILKVPQIFKINFFSHNIFCFFINKCGRYSNIHDFKRLVPEIAHVFIGTILSLLSSG